MAYRPSLTYLTTILLQTLPKNHLQKLSSVYLHPPLSSIKGVMYALDVPELLAKCAKTAGIHCFGKRDAFALSAIFSAIQTPRHAETGENPGGNAF